MKKSKNLILILGCVTIVPLVVCIYFCPIFKSLPMPTGRYGVGIATRSFVDQTRVLHHAHDLAPRELAVDIFYPTEKW